MPTNVEIKARVTDIANLRKRAAQLSGTDGQTLEQEDTFFNCHNGRLKLRVEKVNLKEGQSAEEGQVIARDLMQKLGVKDEDLLTCAYMDLLLNEKSG
nr:hypothetical protein BaRGS_033211 [Batillaria attramentaria]